MIQLSLITGFYRCDDCGRVAGRVRKERRFRLCDACYARVVPEVHTIDASMVGSPAHEAIGRYWEWYKEMEERWPSRYAPPGKSPAGESRPTDQLYPLCECGERRQEVASTPGHQGGLFGGPFLEECKSCGLKRQIEWNVRTTSWLHPEWDDEEWLDLLFKVMPEAFELGILPDYWYELRRDAAGNSEKE